VLLVRALAVGVPVSAVVRVVRRAPLRPGRARPRARARAPRSPVRCVRCLPRSILAASSGGSWRNRVRRPSQRACGRDRRSPGGPAWGPFPGDGCPVACIWLRQLKCTVSSAWSPPSRAPHRGALVGPPRAGRGTRRWADVPLRAVGRTALHERRVDPLSMLPRPARARRV